MRVFCLLIFLLPTIFLSAKERLFPFIAFSYHEFVTAQPDQHIKEVRMNKGENKILVRNEDKIAAYPMKDVFGYRGRNQVSYRIFNRELYRIIQLDTLTIYEKKGYVGSYKKVLYYFSAGLVNPIHRLEIEEIEKVYGATNPLFVSKVKEELKWLHVFDNPSKRHRTFEIVKVYKNTLLQ